MNTTTEQNVANAENATQTEQAQPAKPAQPKPSKSAKPTKTTRKTTNGDANTLQPLAEDASTGTETTIEGKKVTSSYTFRLSANDPNRYRKSTVFDFSNCTQDEILQLAAANVRITAQGRLRAMGQAALNKDALSHIDVKNDILNATRQSNVDDLTKAARSFARASGGKISEAQARAILEKQIK